MTYITRLHTLCQIFIKKRTHTWGKKGLEGIYAALADDFDKLLQVMLEEDLNEFQYIIDGNEWKAVLKQGKKGVMPI